MYVDDYVYSNCQLIGKPFLEGKMFSETDFSIKFALKIQKLLRYFD